MTGVLTEEETGIDMRTHRAMTPWGHSEEVTVYTKEGGLRRNPPCLHLDLDLGLQNCKKINVSYLSHQSVALC